jgi:hypothetical protein
MEPGGEAIARALEKCNLPPKNIDLSYNFIKDKAAKLLIDAASKNTKIISINIEYNSVHIKHLNEIRIKC